MNTKIVPSTWLSDDEFVGTLTRIQRYWIDYEARIIGEQEECLAVYGWAKPGKSFSVYTIDNGHIQKLTTVKRGTLLDFRKVTV